MFFFFFNNVRFAFAPLPLEVTEAGPFNHFSIIFFSYFNCLFIIIIISTTIIISSI